MDPLQVLDDANAGPELVVRSLEAHTSAIHGSQNSREEARSTCKTQNIGILTLHWMLASHSHNKAEVLQASGLPKMIAHTMIAEDAEDYLWQFCIPKK